MLIDDSGVEHEQATTMIPIDINKLLICTYISFNFNIVWASHVHYGDHLNYHNYTISST